MYYPLTLSNLYKRKIWGSRLLADMFGRHLTTDDIGESWDLSCRNRDVSVITNGALSGQLIEDVINADRPGILGTRLCRKEGFPLLIKLISAGDDLSVQVHPDDEYAKANENLQSGKTEAWYILKPPDSGELILGLKDGTDRNTLINAAKSGNITACLNRMPVKAGDMVYIPAGLVHSIGKGMVCVEIQQNSDSTYRLYDYGRKDADGKQRELHIDRAASVIDFDGRLKKSAISGLTLQSKDCVRTFYTATAYFSIIKYDINGTYPFNTDGLKFTVFTCTAGQVRIETDCGFACLCAGETAFMPAYPKKYIMYGNASLLSAFVPDVNDEFILPLKKARYTSEQIMKNTIIQCRPTG